MKIILKYIISLKILLWACIAIYPQSYPFRSISVAEGLQDLIVNALIKIHWVIYGLEPLVL